MKTIRLLYPDFVSGGLTTYWFGAKLLAHMLPDNPDQPLFEVKTAAPGEEDQAQTQGIRSRREVLEGIAAAQAVLEEQKPDRLITVGGNCIVSLAGFDYLHGLYPDAGVIWIDAHPDVSTPEDDYPFAHAMVLGSMLGGGAPALRETMKNGLFDPKRVLYVGLQGLHDYQKKALTDLGVNFRVQTESFVSNEEIAAFASRFAHVFVHLDIDVLDPALFHSTYFANKDLVGDGSGGGRMTMQELSGVLETIAKASDIAGLTLAEYLPFDEERLSKMLSGLSVLTERANAQ